MAGYHAKRVGNATQPRVEILADTLRNMSGGNAWEGGAINTLRMEIHKGQHQVSCSFARTRVAEVTPSVPRYNEKPRGRQQIDLIRTPETTLATIRERKMKPDPTFAHGPSDNTHMERFILMLSKGPEDNPSEYL
jgi:hypothetical protein